MNLVWATMVLILKGKGEYGGIVIVEVAWKVCASVVNSRLKRGAVLHKALHGFREGRGMGTATLEAKLAQRLDGLAHEPLFQFFLDVYKSYDSLDRGLCLEVLRGYGMGLNLVRLFKSYWDCQWILPRMGKFLKKSLRTGMRVTQGDPASPMIFNIVVDEVVWAVLDLVYGPRRPNTAWDGRLGRGTWFFTPMIAG